MITDSMMEFSQSGQQMAFRGRETGIYGARATVLHRCDVPVRQVGLWLCGISDDPSLRAHWSSAGVEKFVLV